MEQKKYDIFVSYSRADIDVVKRLVGDIHEKTKARCWVDWNGIESGEKFVDVIINAIDTVDTVLFVLSDKSMASDFVKREIDYARNTGKKIVPIVVDGGKLRGWFLFFFGSIDYIDVKVPMQYEKLLRNIGDWFGGKSVSGETLQHNEIKVAKKVADSPAVTSKTYKIGDFYDENGKQGIVFDVTADGKHGKIVSLDSQELKWAGLDAYNRRTSATSVDDGMSNLNKIKEIPNWETNYPAFAWCASKGDGWYLPAKNELLSIKRNMATINLRMYRMGAAIMDGSFWSSTEQSDFFAWHAGMGNGYTGSDLKNLFNFYVRAVSAF